MNGNCGECERRYTCVIDPAKCDNLSEPVTMTKADKIRSMTDEEMAKFLLSCDAGNFLSVVCEEGICEDCQGNCLSTVMQWLQQPVEVEE